MLSVSSRGTARVTSPRLLLIVYSPPKRSEVTATTSIFLSHPLAPFFSKHKEEQRATVGAVEGEGWGCVVGGRVGGDGGGGGLGGGVELEKNIERESSDQTALIRRGGRGGVLL